VMSCLDYAASIYGGMAGDYLCSVNATGPATQTAYVDNSGGAQGILAEDFSFDSCPIGYGLGTTNDTSAFVDDHTGTHLTYIFSRAAPCSPSCPPGHFTELSGCGDTADRVCQYLP